MNIDLSLPGIFLILSIPIIIYLSKWYYFRSDLSKHKIVFLATLRAILLFQIVLIFFDPVLNINNSKNTKLKNLILFDNSLSIVQNDSAESNALRSLLKHITDHDEFINYQFGDSIRKTTDLLSLDFNDNFSNINDFFTGKNFKYGSVLKNYDNIVIATDGNFTDYDNTTFSNDIPINFIHTKYRSDEKDLFISDIIYEDIIDTQDENSYELIVGFRGTTSESNFEILVKENNKVVKKITKKIPDNGTLTRIPISLKNNDNTLQTTEFAISNLPNEKNTYNNSRKIYQKVLNKQKNVLVVYGNLSLDLKFFLDIMKKNSISYKLHNSRDKLSSLNTDDHDLTLLYSYPSNKRYPHLDSLISKFHSKLIFITEKSDRKKINILLDLKLNNLKPIYRKGYLENNKDNLSNYLYSWEDEFINLNGLPSIEYDAGFIPNEESYYPVIDINSDKLNHVVYQSIDQIEKTTLINMRYFWKALSIFDNNTSTSELENFFLNIIEHLSIDRTTENIRISAEKPIFTSGEKINFQGKIFDDNLNPLKNEVVKLSIVENNAESKFIYSEGKYSTSLNIIDPGLYTAKISVYANNEEFMSIKKEFKIVENNLELSNLGANMDLMQDIADKTNGKLIPLSESEAYFDTIKGKRKIVTENIKIKLVKNIYFFILLIVLFLIELGYRKYKDLL